MGQVWKIQVVQDGQETSCNTVTEGAELVVGRDPAADVVVVERSVSRRHCKLVGTEGGIQVCDLGSANGVYVGGRRIKDATLKSGEEAQIGLARIKVSKSSAQTGMIPLEGLGTDATVAPGSGLDSSTGGSRTVLESNQQVYRGIEKDRLALLIETGKSLASTVQVEELLERIMDHLFQILPVRRAVVALLDDEGELVPRHVRPQTDELELSTMCSKNIIRQVIESGQPRIIEDASVDQEFNMAQSILVSNIKAAICAPLVSNQRSIGALYADYPGKAKLYTSADLDFFAAFANFAAVALENARMQAELRQRERLQRDLEIAAEIQQGILPDEAFEVPGLDVDWAYWPSQQVGGDFYDCLRLDDDRIALVLGDVSGKSVGAALFMARLMSSLRAVAPENPAPGAVLTRTNRLLGMRSNRVFFATAYYMLLDTRHGKCSYASAGHNPVLVLDADTDEFRELGPTGMPLGIESSYEYSSRDERLDPGTLVVMYTDGVVEARNADGEFFGLDALKRLILECRDEPAKEITTLVIEEVQSFVRESKYTRDDIALLILRMKDE